MQNQGIGEYTGFKYFDPQGQKVSFEFELRHSTKPRVYESVILSAAKNLRLCGLIETLRFAQGDMGKVLLEWLRVLSFQL